MAGQGEEVVVLESLRLIRPEFIPVSVPLNGHVTISDSSCHPWTKVKPGFWSVKWTLKRLRSCK